MFFVNISTASVSSQVCVRYLSQFSSLLLPPLHLYCNKIYCNAGIRKELAALRADTGIMSPNGVASLSPPPKQAANMQSKQQQQSTSAIPSSDRSQVADLDRVNKNLSMVLDSGLYQDRDDPLVKELMKTVQTN